MTTPPNKPIRLVVPFAAGTAPDVLARPLAQALIGSMSANVLVKNVPGAGATIGVDRVAKSASDGHTLLLSGDAALVRTGGAFGVKPPDDTLRDLAPIAQLVITPNVLVVANGVPARNVQKRVALARGQPGKFSDGSGGIGFSTHRAGALMNSMAGLDMVHLPNAGNPWTNVIAGRVQVMFGNIALALPLIKDGKVRGLAVTSTPRATAAPEMPTVSESGLPGFESLSWFGVLAPASTPPAVLQRLEADLQKAMATPAMKERLALIGGHARGPERGRLHAGDQERNQALGAETRGGRRGGGRHDICGPGHPGPEALNAAGQAMLLSLGHVTVRSADFERTERLYGDLLGLCIGPPPGHRGPRALALHRRPGRPARAAAHGRGGSRCRERNRSSRFRRRRPACVPAKARGCWPALRRPRFGRHRHVAGLSHRPRRRARQAQLPDASALGARRCPANESHVRQLRTPNPGPPAAANRRLFSACSAQQPTWSTTLDSVCPQTDAFGDSAPGPGIRREACGAGVRRLCNHSLVALTQTHDDVGDV